ncbi:MAG: TIGR02678 family protein [Solirubrobacteraceae bacterium]
MALTALEQRASDEQTVAARALIKHCFVDAAHPTYPLARRHAQPLQRRFAELLGYRLEVTPGFARLFKRPSAHGLRRPLRIEPGTPTGRRRARDEWPALDRRRAVLLALTAAALEREPTRQTIVGELARSVAEAGARCTPPIPVDIDARGERLALADVLDLLCSWGILTLTHGSRSSFSAREPGEDEALLTIDRRRLAGLMRDPFRILTAGEPSDLLDDTDDYAPTPEGATRRLRHRLARRLVEDPVLYLADLDEDERAYFQTQRHYLESQAAALTGLQVERRREGTALIESGRELTDIAFPAASTLKQVALLLCEPLTESGSLTREGLRAAIRGLLRRHGEAWSRSASDPDHVIELADGAVEVLCGLGLARRSGDTIEAMPLCARFRAPTVTAKGAA